MKTNLLAFLLLTVLLVTSCGKKTETVKEVQKNIGLQLYSLRDAINDEAIGIDSMLKLTGEMGYKFIETANYWEGTIYGMTPEEFKTKAENAGLNALSCHLRQDIIEDKEALWAWWDLCIETHKKAGMKYIVMPSMPTPETLEDLQAYCDYFNRIGEKCVAAGLKFGYHNHAFEFEKVYNDGTVMYDYLLQNTDPSKVFFELDVYWSQKGKRPASELFAAYPGRFDLLHIKDEKELGESGFMNFEDIFNNINNSGAKYLIVEVERYNLLPVESVKASLDYLNNAAFVKEDYSK